MLSGGPRSGVSGTDSRLRFNPEDTFLPCGCCCLTNKLVCTVLQQLLSMGISRQAHRGLASFMCVYSLGVLLHCGTEASWATPDFPRDTYSWGCLAVLWAEGLGLSSAIAVCCEIVFDSTA